MKYSKFDKIITVEDNTIIGGFGSAISEFATSNLKNEILIHGIPDRFIDHGKPEELHEELKIDPKGIAEVAEEFLLKGKILRKKNLKIYLIFVVALFVMYNGCSDNSVQAPTETLIYEYQGVIENVGGDCSAVQVRSRSLGILDLANADRIRINLEGMSDADLSSINIYYIQNDEQVDLVNLPDRDQINSTRSVEVNAPGIETEVFSRVTLKSSVCTGQIFFLTFSNLKIFKVND
ncbi:MAG: transketolase C-terminal domain-containing protein [Ignavibacteria bacterium]